MDSVAAQNETPSGKVRILLQTLTHLVPGKDAGEKLTFVRNLVCQHHWKRDFNLEQERYFPFMDYFGLKNRKCFFLIDHHGENHAIQEERVPVLWYRWTGESLIYMQQDLPPRYQRELKKWPFTWEGRKFHKIAKGPDGKYSPEVYRDKIRAFLRIGTPLLEEQYEFLRDFPEHAKWLRTRLEPELWAKIEPFCQLPLRGP